MAIGRSELQLCCGCRVLVDHIDSVIIGSILGVGENAACAAQFVRTVNTGRIDTIGRVRFTQRSGRNCTPPPRTGVPAKAETGVALSIMLPASMKLSTRVLSLIKNLL